MTIALSDNTPRVSYAVASGVTQTTFTVNFEFFDDSDLNFYVDGTLKTLATHYTVTGGSGSTGTITTTAGNEVVGIAGGSTVTITRDVELSRVTDFPSSGAFEVAKLNTELDRFTAIASDLNDGINRTIRMPDSDPVLNVELPSATARADKIFKFDTEGNIEAVSANELISNTVIGANYTNNTFIGDGSTVAYTTTVAAGSKNNCQIYIDGVYQEKSTFSISTTTLTFTEAPPLNASIEVIIGNAIETLDADSGNINYNQGGTGAQTRTVESRLQDVISALDIGISTSNTGAQNRTALLNYISPLTTGITIKFPSGLFLFDANTLISKDGIHLVGSGINATTLKIDANGGASCLIIGGATTADQVNGGSISHMTIDGNYPTITGLLDKVLVGGVRCKNVSFHDLLIQNMDGKGVGFDGGLAGTSDTENCKIYNVTVTNCTEQAVHIDGSSGSTKNITIDNVNVYDSGHAGIFIGDGASNVAVSNSTIELNNATWDAISLRDVSNVSITNIVGKAGRHGLSMLYISSGCSNVTVSSCVFEENDLHGVLLDSTQNITISSVISKNNGTYGFLIHSTPACDSTVLIGCMAIDDQGSPTQNDGYHITNSATQTFLIGCGASGNVTNDVYIDGSIGDDEIFITNGPNITANFPEEGLISSPVVFGSTSAGSATYTQQGGTYSKIGNRVFFNIDLAWSGHTGTGFMRIGALPYASDTANVTYNAISIHHADLTLGTNYIATGAVVGNTIYMYKTLVGGSALSNVSMDAAASISVSGHYKV